MRKTKRVFSLMLALVTALPLLTACSGQSAAEAPDTTEQTTVEPTEEPIAAEAMLDAELLRAQSAGLLPEAWLEDMEATATFAEYANILTRAVELWNKDAVPEFEGHMRLAADADEPMKVEDGYLMLSYLWVQMGKSEIWPGDFMQNAWTMTPQEVQDEAGRELRWNYPHFPDFETIVYHYRNSNYIWGAMMDFPMVMSPVSGEFMFPYDAENNSLYLNQPLMRDMAVRSLLRMLEYCRVELDENWRDYVALADAGTYDKSIITDELLNAPSGLPEVTQAKLPSEWRGIGLAARKANAEQYLHFSESDIRFLAENGFNVARLFLSFETLRYPDYPENVRIVNQCELRELDQLLAWCLKYDVHLQIAMLSYLRADGTTNLQEDSVMPKNDEEWALTRDYWMMLATRYAGISSKYLTFDLCNEAEPRGGERDIAYAKQGLATVVAAIREADPERVLLYSQAGQASTAWAEAFASLGVAAGCHVYAPNVVTLAGWEYYGEENPYAVPCWPLPWFPMGNVMISKADIVLTGAIDDTDLSVHAWNSGAHPCVVVYADGQEVGRLYLQGEPRGDNEYYYGERLYTTHIPSGTKEVKLRVGDDWARLDTITIERNGVKTVLLASDTIALPDYVEPLPMIVNGDGTYTNSENCVYDEDLIYEVAVKPYRDIAEKYGVGFVCNEFAMCGVKVYWDIGLVTAVHETCINMMEKYNLGWCYSEEFNIFPKHLRILYGDKSAWTGATVEEVAYTYDDGRTETVKYCKELVNQLRAHTMK